MLGLCETKDGNIRMKLRFECKKCGFKEVYDIKSEDDLGMAGSAFGERHTGQEHSEIAKELREARDKVTIEIVLKYVRIVDDETGIDIPVQRDMRMG